MVLTQFSFWLAGALQLNAALKSNAQAQRPLVDEDKARFRVACPAYQDYAAAPHGPYSKGSLALPFQRPSWQCRTFSSPLVENVIKDVTELMMDKDLARIFENAFPNTLDTTVSWHVDGKSIQPQKKHAHHKHQDDAWKGAQSFIVTGDITAEWLRDSTNQLQGYQALAAKDNALASLILGAINTQTEYVIESPYCNAFQPPPPSGLSTSSNGQGDSVHPAYEPEFVFECKYELDSLAHFLKLGNEYYKHTAKKDFLTPRWYKALDALLLVIEQQSKPTFDKKTGRYRANEYTFQRNTNVGTETLNLRGLGNPISGGTGLIRSAFRPSDDATILPFFIPANAMMAVELRRTSTLLKDAGKKSLSEELSIISSTIEAGIHEYGIVNHAKYGKVYAFEVDGFGSQIIMDDANLPSLLALPLLGFVDVKDEVYQNTRKMILEKKGNPYYLAGHAMSGIGGPHIGLEYAWPMSLLVQAMTSDDDEEILNNINTVRNSSKIGLVHESVHVEVGSEYTRSWFAWANSVFAQTILDIAERKPHLLFGEGAESYTVADSMV